MEYLGYFLYIRKLTLILLLHPTPNPLTPYPCSPSHIFISIFILPYVLITQQYLCPKRKTNHSASYLYLALDPEAKCFIPHWIFAILNGFGPDSLRGGSGQGQAYVAISLANCI